MIFIHSGSLHREAFSAAENSLASGDVGKISKQVLPKLHFSQDGLGWRPVAFDGRSERHSPHSSYTRWPKWRMQKKSPADETALRVAGNTFDPLQLCSQNLEQLAPGRNADLGWFHRPHDHTQCDFRARSLVVWCKQRPVSVPWNLG